MNLTGIISISGKPGLFKVVAQGKNNIIVESLEDKKRFPAYSTDRISSLDDISVYTYEEDVALREVLTSIFNKEKGGTCISHKADKKELEKYILEVLPNYDQERVYLSDVKKIFQWYNLLHKSGLLTAEEEAAEEQKEEVEEEKPAKKEAAKGEKKAKTETTAKKAAPKAKEKAPAKAATPKPTAAKKTTTVKTGAARGK